MGEVVLREAVLRDGTRATISPARHEDRELLRVSYESLSPESQFHRFLTAVPHLTDRMLDQLVDDVDWIDHVALVLAVQPEDAPAQKVAIARLIRYDNRPTDADVAVTVLDAWQGLGIATLLLDELLRLLPDGITRLVTEVAGDNPAAVAMLVRLGRTSVTPTSRDSVEVVVDVTGSDVQGGDGAVAPS